MTFSKLSKKQKEVFRWCYKGGYKAIICDGAVRSGKTICMITSYVLWAMKRFSNASFGICGKTVASAERNIIMPLRSIADITHFFKLSYSTSKHLLTVESRHGKNYFYVFGGKDESSYELLQGITLSGIFLDEVALMPQSFVNQAIARCLSVSQSLYWFNCNPESPAHWFYTEWICNAEKRKALHLHFLAYTVYIHKICGVSHPVLKAIKAYCVDNLLACIGTYKRYTECKYQIDRVDMSAFFYGSLHIHARFFSKAFHAAYLIKMLGQMIYVRELFYESLIYKF